MGSSTIVVDDPELTARPDDEGGGAPTAGVVVDTRGRTPPMARVFTGWGTLVATVRLARDLEGGDEAPGAEVLTLPDGGYHVDLMAAP